MDGLLRERRRHKWWLEDFGNDQRTSGKWLLLSLSWPAYDLFSLGLLLRILRFFNLTVRQHFYMPNCVMTSAWRSSLKTSPRPEKNRTKTGLSKDCSLGLSNFQMKDRRKTGLYGPVETGLLCPSITPSNVAQDHVNWLKTDWDIQHFVKCSITTQYFIDIFISSSILAHFGRLRARFET